MPGEPPASGPGFDKLENFNFLMSRHDPTAKTREYAFDADTGLVPFGNVSMDYDQTEGMGGLSVSSYDSIEDDRSSLDLRGYPYHGTCQASCLSFLFITQPLHFLRHRSALFTMCFTLRFKIVDG